MKMALQEQLTQLKKTLFKAKEELREERSSELKGVHLLARRRVAMSESDDLEEDDDEGGGGGGGGGFVNFFNSAGVFDGGRGDADLFKDLAGDAMSPQDYNEVVGVGALFGSVAEISDEEKEGREDYFLGDEDWSSVEVVSLLSSSGCIFFVKGS